MRDSLRTQLVAGMLASVAVIWIALVATAWFVVRHEAEEVFDAHLAQTAALLVAFVHDEADEIEEHLPSHQYERKVAFQIWEAGTRLLTHSAAAGESRLSAIDEGFSDSAGWRVYGLWNEDRRYLIQVAEARQARNDLSEELAGYLLVPVGGALPLLIAALTLLIRTGLAPLDRVAASIAERSPDRLDAIPLDGTPRELHPILDRLNALLARIARSIEQERRFTADASHELRTPLAAIRTHAQIAAGSRDDAARSAAFSRICEATDRATHLVEQMLMLARLDTATLAGRFTTCDLCELSAEALANAAPAALERNIELSLTRDAEVSVRGEPTLLAVMLRNLVDNAVRYGSPNTGVDVLVSSAADGAPRFEVRDRGPGIPHEERARVLDRFYRIAGSDEAGSGLGLSIVAKIAERHGARIELGDNPDGRGLRVCVIFMNASATGAAP